jgi:hypothetical protein
MYVCMYIRMYMHVCVYVLFIYACMYVHILCIYIYMHVYNIVSPALRVRLYRHYAAGPRTTICVLIRALP